MAWYRRTVGPLFIALCFTPLIALMGAHVLEASIIRCELMLLATVVAQFIACDNPLAKKHRIVRHFFGAVAHVGVFGLCVWYTGSYGLGLWLLLPALRAHFVALSLEDSMSAIQAGFGIACYLAVAALAIFQAEYATVFNDVWRELSANLNVLGFVFIACALLIYNQGNLIGTSSIGKRNHQRPILLYRPNLMMVMALFLIAVVVALGAGGSGLWGGVVRAGNAVMRWTDNLVSREYDGIIEREDDPEAGGEAPELPVYLQHIADVVLIAAAVALVVLVLVGFFLLIRLLLRMLKDQSKIADVADYEEEKTNMLPFGALMKKTAGDLAARLSRLRAETGWKELDTRARVRFAYKQFVRRRRANLTYTTARGALAQPTRLPPALAKDFAPVYDKARYSSQPISEQEEQAAFALFQAVTTKNKL